MLLIVQQIGENNKNAENICLRIWLVLMTMIIFGFIGSSIGGSLKMPEARTFLIGRRADNGKLVPVEFARKHKNTCVVERMPKKGHGDTGRK